MQLFIKSPDGHSQVVDVSPNLTISDIKKTLNLKNVKLSKGGFVMCDHQTIQESDIHNGDTLDISPSLLGGCTCRCSCSVL